MSNPPYEVILKVEVAGQLSGRPVRLEASVEHEDGYELITIPVVALFKQYDAVRKPGRTCWDIWLIQASMQVESKRRRRLRPEI